MKLAIIGGLLFACSQLYTGSEAAKSFSHSNDMRTAQIERALDAAK